MEYVFLCCWNPDRGTGVRRVPPGAGRRPRPAPANPRRHLGELTELAASIARQGVLDELVVVAGEKAGRWWIEGP